MKLNRRQFVAGTSALLAVPAIGRAATAPRIIEARSGLARVAPDSYPETEIWGYDGGVPGPEIRARQGETVRRTLLNSLPQPTAIHWHGILVDRMETREIAFVADNPGDWLFHCHMLSHQAGGMKTWLSVV